MLFSKIHADLKNTLTSHRVVRTRGDGTLTYGFVPRAGNRPIYYEVIEYRSSVVLRNLNTGFAKSYALADKENLLCMLRTIQRRQTEKKFAGSGHGNVRTIPAFLGMRELFTTMVSHVKQATQFTGSDAASITTKSS